MNDTKNKKFATALCCIDGRITIPVIEKIKEITGIDYVDFITAPGMNKVLAEGEKLEDVKEKVAVSISAHNSQSICVVGHTNCAGNLVDCNEHVCHIKDSMSRVSSWFPNVVVYGLIAEEIDGIWQVREI